MKTLLPDRFSAKGRVVHTKSGLRLTVLQEAFAQAYTDFCAPSFCNAYRSLVSTRPFNGTKESGYAYAYQLRTHPATAARILELLERRGFLDEDVDLQHLAVIRQEKDLTNKMRAIEEYNRMRNRKRVQEPPQVQIIDFTTFQAACTPLSADV
jgi:hypothetical protein